MARVGDRRGAYRVLVGKLERKKHLEDLGADGEDDVKIGVQEVGWGGMDSIDLACDRDLWRARVNALVNLGVT